MRRWENNPVLRAQWGASIKALRAVHPEIGLAQSASLKDLFASHPEILRKQSDKMRKYHAAHPELGRKHSDYIGNRWKDVKWRAAVIAGQKNGYVRDTERASKHAKCMEGLWQDQEFHDRMSAIQTSRYENRTDRLMTGADCQASRILRGSSGFKGVSKHGSGWTVRIKYDRETYRLGTYPTPELAALVYNDAAREFYGASAFQNVIPSN